MSTMPILNLTQHRATPEQLAQGVVDLGEEEFNMLKDMLTFVTIPSRIEVIKRANAIAMKFSEGYAGDVMLGGAPYLMPFLHERMEHYGCTPYYAFSERVSIEETLPDGSVVKTNIFKHVGFV